MASRSSMAPKTSATFLQQGLRLVGVQFLDVVCCIHDLQKKVDASLMKQHVPLLWLADFTAFSVLEKRAGTFLDCHR